MVSMVNKEVINASDVTVIVAIYNHFHWLRLILDALRQQSVVGFEVVIADDGSSDETVKEIVEYQKDYPELRVVHVWQPDEGWRKNKSLNNAVRNSSGKYLVFVDGDCIPHPRFVEDHILMSRAGYVIGGRRVDMSEDVSWVVEKWDSLPKGYFAKVRREVFKNIFRTRFGETIRQLRRTMRFPYWNGNPMFSTSTQIMGCNFGIYKSDLEKVNGFDERYIDPGTGEDIDLDVRLENSGVRHLKVSHNALMLHRHHQRQDFSSENNAKLYRAARQENVTYVREGLNRD